MSVNSSSINVRKRSIFSMVVVVCCCFCFCSRYCILFAFSCCHCHCCYWGYLLALVLPPLFTTSLSIDMDHWWSDIEQSVDTPEMERIECDVIWLLYWWWTDRLIKWWTNVVVGAPRLYSIENPVAWRPRFPFGGICGVAMLWRSRSTRDRQSS